MGIAITPAGVASAVRDLAAEGSIDLSEITKAVEEITSARTLAVLKAQIALEATKSKGRRFLMACSWQGGKSKVSRGMEYPAVSRDGSEIETPRVFVDDRAAPFYCHYDSMEELKTALKNHEVTYHIEYID